jgi:hypothetical protein
MYFTYKNAGRLWILRQLQYLMGIKALSLCLGLLVCLALAFAEIVVIGSEQIVSQGLPFEPVARYSYSQQLFSPAEIGSAGQISTSVFNTQSAAAYSTMPTKN